jgi:hypothetical protein
MQQYHTTPRGVLHKGLVILREEIATAKGFFGERHFAVTNQLKEDIVNNMPDDTDKPISAVAPEDELEARVFRPQEQEVE